MHVESWSASVCVSSSLFYVAPSVFFVVSFAFKPRTNLAMNFEVHPNFETWKIGTNCSERARFEWQQTVFLRLSFGCRLWNAY
jgi:hypothetical protein